MKFKVGDSVFGAYVTATGRLQVVSGIVEEISFMGQLSTDRYLVGDYFLTEDETVENQSFEDLLKLSRAFVLSGNF